MGRKILVDYLSYGASAFFYHKVSEAEGGYNYYGYMHRNGQSYVMRETISTGEALYASAEHKLANWDDHVGLAYSDIYSV